MEQIESLEKKLKLANERLKKAAKALAPKHKGGEVEEFLVAQKEKIIIEREYSMARDWETAFKIDWKPEWNTGAPCPYILSSENNLFLIYLIDQHDSHWDRTYVNVIDSKSDQIQSLALIEFRGFYAYKFGGMNDEVWSGHPLYERGLEAYSAHVIENSKWLNGEKKINSVHSGYQEESWLKRKHYLLLFHDEIFECLAEGYSVETYSESFESVVKKATKKLFKHS